VIASFGEERRIGLCADERSIDYTERRSLALSIPDYTVLQANGEKFQVRLEKVYCSMDERSLLGNLSFS
jgi:hypothetical protein